MSDYTQSAILILVYARVAAISTALAGLAWAQPREKASDYPEHAKLADREIGVEYLVHSVPVERGVLLASDYLVVEVAVFPLTLAGVTVSSSPFTLRINGKKTPVYPQSTGMVAASMKYPDYENTRPRLIAEAGPVIIGAPQPVARFPGDPSARRQPPVAQVPDAPDRGATEKESQPSIEEQVKRAALADEHTTRPRRGVLFFPYQGKTKSIRSLELAYDPGEGAPPVKIHLL
jgi:hypothetical protein